MPVYCHVSSVKYSIGCTHLLSILASSSFAVGLGQCLYFLYPTQQFDLEFDGPAAYSFPVTHHHMISPVTQSQYLLL